LGDLEILESDLKLADAQQLVARLEGFDDWQALFKDYRLKAGRILRDWKSWLRLEAA